MPGTMWFTTEADEGGRPRGIVTVHDLGEGVVAILINGEHYLTLDDGVGSLPFTLEEERIVGVTYAPTQGDGHALIVKLDE